METWISIAIALVLGVAMGLHWGYKSGLVVGKRREGKRIARVIGHKTVEQVVACIIKGEDFVGEEIPNDRKKSPVALRSVKKAPDERTH